MKISYFHIVLLYCLKQFNGERSASAIYHLLKGKKSSQTIQDGKLFNISHMFSIFPKLSRVQTNSAWHDLLQKGYIEELPENQFLITEMGKIELETALEQRPFPKDLHGWNYGDIGRLFWRRLSLLVQVLSNMAYERKVYLPVTKNQDDLQWVKMFLKQIKMEKLELIKLLHIEIFEALKVHDDKKAVIFVRKLTSSQKIGLTFDQIAVKEEEDAHYIYLMFWSVIHSFIYFQQLNDNQFPLFNEIIKDKFQVDFLTSSSQKTKTYLLQGKSIQEISRVRRLKESTIEDHIIEITLHDKRFQPWDFLSESDYNIIKKTIIELKTHQLKKVREVLGKTYSYFQIRLVFALMGRKE
ncbi:helix-turn-helix domain-containing protein [Metabacillus litoralis]|uniref:helix-turn-helix domain-containing protein n=1 Tax=Metabacillus litoralis TaxID=152268 RepID=UPI001CFF3A33|nr:helix-turn-helix domain-containing protein [Metabacillus litoralis]